MKLQYWFSLISIFLFHVNSTIVLYHLQITQSNQTFTVTFDNAFKNFPKFSFFIESGTIQNNEFSLTYDQQRTLLTNTQITINFLTRKATAFSGQSLKVALLITDSWGSQFQIGVKIVNISTNMVFDFSNLTLVYKNASRGIIEIYSLSYPLVYSSALDYTQTSKLLVNITQSSVNYKINALFSYIYFTSNYLGSNVAAIFSQINQTSYGYVIPYRNFAFTPSIDNVLFALRQYSSTSSFFLNCQEIVEYTYERGIAVSFNFNSINAVRFNSDMFFFNNSFSGCQESQFLYYIALYETLPYSCLACHPTCLSCATSSQTNPTQTDQYSCLKCTWMGYLNATQNGNGKCICFPGVKQINGICQQCEQACLTFSVVYIQTTNQSNFLLTYSYTDVVQQIPLGDNLIVYLNGIQIIYGQSQHQNSYYIITIDLDDMKVCEEVDTCQFQFVMQKPYQVLKSNLAESLSMNNATLQIQNYIDYYSLVPSSLQGAFNIMGIAIGMAFAGGSTSLVTILFQLQQLIDAHRYLKLTLPVVFNELLYNMLYFRFLSILNLFPKSYTQEIQDIVPQDLDNLGPSKLRYYQSGLNLYKNSITGFISVVGLLFINLVIYYILKLIPLKATRKLAKKIAIRKFITIHDTLQQLQLPFFYYSLQQLQIVILQSNLYWIYGMAIMISGIIIGFPFLIVIFIYQNKDNKQKIQIYQDLMQDNKMNQKVTYIYYLFNYYRKIFFAMFLLSIFPGLVQIYLLILLNCLHLAFQVYLVVARTYKSKMKIVIRFINDICIITIEVLILLYNLNNYEKTVMINIGMSCLYLAVVTTIMGIIDVIVKVVDTCRQELSSKNAKNEEEFLTKKKIQKDFKVIVNCYIGQQLPQISKDPKQLKFMEDKQLMQNTFDKQNDSQKISVQLHNYNQQSSNGDLDLVYIENDEEEVPEPINFRPQLNNDHRFVKKQKQNKYEDIELYQIPKDIDREAKKINKSRRLKKNKYELDQQQRQANSTGLKQKQSKQTSKSNTLVIKNTRQKEQSSESNDIQDIISQQ